MSDGGHCAHQHHDHGGDDAHVGPELGVQYTLYTKIDLDNVQCLNEATEGSGKTVFKPWDERLDFSRVVESDCDEELLFSIPFTGNVKLKGIIIVGGEGDTHPSALRMYKNRPNMSFDDVSVEPDQEFELNKDSDGTLEYPTRVVKFASIHHLTLHFPKSFGADKTKVVYIGLKGEFTEAHRQEIAICNYELAPNPADHKIDQQCSTKNYESLQNNNNLGF